MDKSRRVDHILRELASYSGPAKRSSDKIMVLCPYHTEKTPSGIIGLNPNARAPGFFYCFGCGARARWDEVAPKLGLKPYTYAKPTTQYARVAVQTIEDDETDHVFEYKDLPKNKIWREISTNLLIDIGCKKIQQWGTNFIYMPVMVRGVARGYIRARMRKQKGKPSYLNQAGEWTKKYGLFPYDYAVKDKPKTVVLVEGQRDALRLLSYGIPAVAILGTQSWSRHKTRYLELSGAENVVLCMDGDCAGKDAVKLLTPALQGFFGIHTFDLAGKDSPYWQFRRENEPTAAAKKSKVELWDPGNMPEKKIKQLKKFIKSIEL